jgi:hypothetical protein
MDWEKPEQWKFRSRAKSTLMRTRRSRKRKARGKLTDVNRGGLEPPTRWLNPKTLCSWFF